MLTEEQAAIVKGLLARGDKQHDIAAYFGENGGRIGEVAKGKTFPDVKPAPKRSLPPPEDIVPWGFIITEARAAIEIAAIGLASARSRLAEIQTKLQAKEEARTGRRP